MSKQYLGDSVYAEFNGEQITLTTDNGEGPSNTIILESGVLREFQRFIAEVTGEPQQLRTRVRRRTLDEIAEGFTIVGEDDQLKVPGAVCKHIAQLPEVAQYRRIHGDAGLSSRIVETILHEMNEEKLSQEVVNRYAKRINV